MRHIVLVLLVGCGGAGDKPGDTATGTTAAGTTSAGATGAGTTGAGTTGAGTTGAGTTGAGTTGAGTTGTGTTPTGTTPTGSTGTTPGDTGDTGGPPRFSLESGPPLTCADPAARGAAWFDLVELDGVPIDFFWLIGVGVGAVQLDADPELELLRARDHEVQRFDRAPDGRWVELEPLRLDDPTNLSVADYDGDGDNDVFVGALDAPNHLYENDGAGGLVDVTDRAGLGRGSLRTMSAAWSDIDRDGDLDLVVGNYGSFPVRVMNSHRSELFLNNGDGTFTDVSERLPREVHEGYVFMSGWFDVNHDGWPDLFSIHDYFEISHSRLLIADGAGGFAVDEGSLFHGSFFGMGFAAQDVNGDRVPDVTQSGFNRFSQLESLPSADALGGSAWIEYSAARGIRLLRGLGAGDLTQTFGWGMAWQDLDNDTDLDLAVAFGDWEPELAGPALRPMNPHPDALWLSQDGMYTESAALHGFDDTRTNRGLAAADIDRNGWLDLVVATHEGPTTVRTSRCGAEHWLNVQVADRTTANTAAVGAEVLVRAGDTEQVRWITAGSSSMFSAEPIEAHIGLGALEIVDELVVTYPDGEVARFTDVPVDRFIVVTRNPVE